MKSILVTGGAGFIGSHTVVELHNSGYRPVIIDNFSNSDEMVIKRLEKITGEPTIYYKEDCNDPEVIRRIIIDENIDGIIHFAAYKAVGESVEFPLKYYRNNVGSTLAVLEAMEESGVKQLAFSSSCTVYGEPNQLPVSESADIKPAESPYGNTKQMCEEIIRDATHANDQLKAISLRYFNPIGAHPSSLIGELPIGVPNNLVPFITQTAAGLREKLTVFGDDYSTPDGTCIRDYIHVVDLAIAHIKALEFTQKMDAENNYEAINIGTGTGHTVLEVIRSFEITTGQTLNYTIGPRRPGDVEKVYADSTKANKMLNWKAQFSLEQCMRDAWNWQKTL